MNISIFVGVAMRCLNRYRFTRDVVFLRSIFSLLCFGIILNINHSYADESFVVTGNTYEESYIHKLDLTVANQYGEVEITKIGLFSPFRRYSWFRVGDIIETINGKKTTVLVLSALKENSTPWVKYRRGSETSEIQIGLEKTIFGHHDYSTLR